MKIQLLAKFPSRVNSVWCRCIVIFSAVWGKLFRKWCIATGSVFSSFCQSEKFLVFFCETTTSITEHNNLPLKPRNTFPHFNWSVQRNYLFVKILCSHCIPAELRGNSKMKSNPISLHIFNTVGRDERPGAHETTHTEKQSEMESPLNVLYCMRRAFAFHTVGTIRIST